MKKKSKKTSARAKVPLKTKWRTIKLKSGLKKKVKVSARYSRLMKEFANEKWTSAKISVFERGDLRPKSWLSISNSKTGLVYISRSPGTRSYWALSKMKSNAWPNFRWNSKNLSLTVNSTKIVFKTEGYFKKAKAAFDKIRPQTGKG